MAHLLHITELKDGGDGQKYPHIYGPLTASSVTEVIPVTRDATGRLILPENR